MKILLTGASGLIGAALLPRLLADGHQLTAVCRHAGAPAVGLTWQQVDMAQRLQPADWLPLLADVDLVINAAGILREQPGQHFATLHAQAPAALFVACELAGVRRVIQLSALGARLDAPTAYWRSKAAGDAALQTSGLDWAIVRPSLVYADEGASSALFRRLAAAPCLLLPAGAGVVQPIHLDDLLALLVALVKAPSLGARIIDAVGPQPLAFADYLQALGQGMGRAPAPVCRLPDRLAQAASCLAQYLPGSLLSPASLAMLREDNRADVAPIEAILGRPLRAPASFCRPVLHADALLALWLPMARAGLAFIWLFTAWVSLYNAPEGLRLLANAGLPPGSHTALLWAGAGLDAVLGLLTVLHPSRRLWQAQMALVLGYTLFISLSLPQWWLHPFGPISKNLPILLWLALLLGTSKPAASPRPPSP